MIVFPPRCNYMFEVGAVSGFQLLTCRHRTLGDRLDLTVYGLVHIDLSNSIIILVISIERQLVKHPHPNEDHNSHPDGESCDIDGSISTVTLQVANSYPEKIDKHGCLC